MDVTPRQVATDKPRTRRRVWVYVAVVVIVAALAFVLFNGLRSATLFFLNVDEAVEQRDDLGDDRIRMQGNVVADSVLETADGVSFEVTYNDVDAAVVHQGDPPQLFQPGIPVVLEGQWDGEVFRSDRILIKHDAEYEADNPERIAEANEDAGEEQTDTGVHSDPDAFDPESADTEPAGER
ncbi:MAG: Cytochrome c-type biogenesis protein CcmE [Acidimicrobiales bacterium]|nr:MAG: cytochrome c maturation protein CcmE [Actinomycetota bacterium]MBV6510384.1 Cytochrome c-type biogenesis protein CcmE [Acidimicrobiales bacterium]RIK03219.1 MAG: hypothetical protein DCC48_17045 [Acidobacteriota bacterium]